MEIGLEAFPLDPRRRVLEVVERKGVGHPDTLCDRAAEAFSRRLSQLYLERTGRIRHHNVDKLLLVAGRTRVGYGGGEWLAPLSFRLAGRVTPFGDDAGDAVEAVARAAVAEAVAPLRNLDSERVQVHLDVRPGSESLVDLFGRDAVIPLANDTSIGAGFAPLTPTESVALEVERALNAAGTKRETPALGEDVKVMAVRHGDVLHLTVAVALVARFVPNAGAYADAVERARRRAAAIARESGFADLEMVVNAADSPLSPYLTLSGTSAEAGDDGQVGRGNRVSGLITPMRPMTIEAQAGKNPVTHAGRLYAIAAQRIAESCDHLPLVRGAECFLVSRIGRPITEPHAAGVRLDAPPEVVARVAEDVRSIARHAVESLPGLWKELLQPPG